MNEVSHKWNSNLVLDNGEPKYDDRVISSGELFQEDTNESEARNDGKVSMDTARLKFLVGLTASESLFDNNINEQTVQWSNQNEQKLVEEVLYQNKAALTDSTQASRPSSLSMCSISLDFNQNTSDDVNDLKKRKRRHSSSVEITAMTSLKSGQDGIPVISFSFLQNGEKPISSSGADHSYDDNVDLQLYDFPKSSRILGVGGVVKSVEDFENLESSLKTAIDVYDFPTSNRLVSPEKPRKNYDNAIIKNCESKESVSEDLYEIPNAKVSRNHGDGMILPKHSTPLNVSSHLDESFEKSSEHHGSYSDPEENYRTKEKRNKYKLGKAWGRMRSWLREEKMKIGEVVQRHAKMQAVGAAAAAAAVRPQNMDLDSSSSSRCGSYDLVEARTREFGVISVIDEFGLSSVSEEANVSEIDEPEINSYDLETSKCGDCRLDEKVDEKLAGNLGKKTCSIENVGGREMKLTPISFSLDKLCDETDDKERDTKEVVDQERELRHLGKGGLIKKRMLGSIRGLMASTHLLHQSDTDETGPGGFEDIRRYVKQGGDFCKELAAILQERAELEASYAKGLIKLSGKLTKACAKDQGGNSLGGVNEAWRGVGEEMESAAEAHRVWGIALSEQLAKPLRVGVAEAQGRSRKSIESSVDKASKSLQEWRSIAAKSKKQSFACARENERLQDLARIQSISQSQQNNNKTSSHHMTEKEVNKLENRRRKAEDSSRRADTEFYTVSVRAERARLEYESTVRKGAKQMELLEEERLSALKDLANVYLSHLQALAPKLQASADRLSTPVRNCSVSHDVDILKNLIRRMDNNESPNVEQLLPDFYAEHVTLAMNRERRKQALVRVLHLIRQDLERERRGREGLETLHRAFIQTPAFAADESTQNVTDKLVHMRSMLTYFEAARYKVGGALAEIEGGKRPKHPLAEHILVSRDKQGLQQSVLKMPSWAKGESFEVPEVDDDIEIHLTKDNEANHNDWVDRTAGDGNSENPPDEEDFSDFDEFSSQSEDNNNQEVDVGDLSEKNDGRIEQCRALYQYSANLNDELSLSPGDLITIHQKQADGWWIGECGGRTGIFPATYVQVLH